MRYNTKIEMAFECTARILSNHSNRFCPTKNSLSDQPVFSAGRNGIFFSTPDKPSLKFSCNGTVGEKTPDNTVGIVEVPEECDLYIAERNETYTGHREQSEVYFSEDALGIGDLT